MTRVFRGPCLHLHIAVFIRQSEHGRLLVEVGDQYRIANLQRAGKHIVRIVDHRGDDRVRHLCHSVRMLLHLRLGAPGKVSKVLIFFFLLFELFQLHQEGL